MKYHREFDIVRSPKQIQREITQNLTLKMECTCYANIAGTY